MAVNEIGVNSSYYFAENEIKNILHLLMEDKNNNNQCWYEHVVKSLHKVQEILELFKNRLIELISVSKGCQLPLISSLHAPSFSETESPIQEVHISSRNAVLITPNMSRNVEDSGHIPQLNEMVQNTANSKGSKDTEASIPINELSFIGFKNEIKTEPREEEGIVNIKSEMVLMERLEEAGDLISELNFPVNLLNNVKEELVISESGIKLGKLRGRWNERNMKAAVEKVVNLEMTLRQASIHFSVPKSTLGDRVKNIKTGKETIMKPDMGAFRNTFTEQQELQLYSHIKRLSNQRTTLSKQEIRKLVFQFAEHLKISHRFNREKGMAGKAFCHYFMKRHPELV